MHVGDPVSHKLNDQTVWVEVIDADQSNDQGEDSWTVRFEDGNTLNCGEKQLLKLVVKTNRVQEKNRLITFWCQTGDFLQSPSANRDGGLLSIVLERSLTMA